MPGSRFRFAHRYGKVAYYKVGMRLQINNISAVLQGFLARFIIYFANLRCLNTFNQNQSIRHEGSFYSDWRQCYASAGDSITKERLPGERQR